MARTVARERVAPAPRGWRRMAWLGPGIVWMLSAAASGELLLTPRVGALYGYALVWAVLVGLLLKFFINREIGRYAVVTGNGLLEGFARVPGPGNWAVWLLLVPQLVVASATIAGLAGSAGTALILFLPGPVEVWTAVTIVTATAVVLYGHYRGVELVSTVIAVTLGIAAIIAAGAAFGQSGESFTAGLVPGLPEDADLGELLPWLGFLSAGAAGLVWYSYWIRAKGYGMAAGAGDVLTGEQDTADRDTPLSREETGRLRGWVSMMTLDSTVAVVGTGIVTLAFLILGVELLRPEGLVPEQDQVAEVLGGLLEGAFGRIGFWFMIVAVYIGFWDTVLSDDDGFMRMFANGTRILGRRLRNPGRLADEPWLARTYLLVLLTVLPVALYLVIGEPVGLLQLAGGIEAAQIPLVAAVVLWVNRTQLPRTLRPSLVATLLTALAGVFFLGFAGYFVVQLVSGNG